MKGNDFVSDLVAAMPTPQARLLLAACLAKYAGQTIYLPCESKQDRRVRAAFNMLANGLTPGETVGALVQRFGCSARTAQRDVESARKMAKSNGVFR